jgi:hypothetical protein
MNKEELRDLMCQFLADADAFYTRSKASDGDRCVHKYPSKDECIGQSLAYADAAERVKELLTQMVDAQ